MRSSVEGTLGNSGSYVEIASYQPSPTFPPPAHIAGEDTELQNHENSIGKWHFSWAAGPVAVFVDGLYHGEETAYLSWWKREVSWLRPS